MRRLMLLLLPVIASCGGTQQKVTVAPTITPLKRMKETFRIPKLRIPPVPAGSYVPAKFIRVYRCSYVDDNGNVRKGEFIWIKVREEHIQASF